MMMGDNSDRIGSNGAIWFNSLKGSRRCGFSSGFWLCNWVFMGSGKLTVSRGDLVSVMWRIKSCRIDGSIEFEKMVLLVRFFGTKLSFWVLFGKAFVIRQDGWMIIYLVFIMHQDYTRSSDVVWICYTCFWIC